MSEEIKEVKISRIDIKDPVPWSKGGNSGNRWNVGIEIDGTWANTTVWDEKGLAQIKELQEGVPVSLVFFDEEYQGNFFKKFRFPTKNDLLEKRVSVLENIISDLHPDMRYRLGQ